MPRTARASRLLAVVALAAGLAATPPSARAAGAEADSSDDDYGRMVLVLDASGSMAEPTAGGGTKMQAAKQALTEVVGELPAESEVGLRVYGAEVFDKDQKGACTDSQLAVPLGTDNRDELTGAIAGFKPYGETPIAHALREAADDVGKEGKRSIVLVSDGIATCQPDPCEVAAELTAAGIDLAIDVVGLGVSGQARNQLQCIADRGNGTYYNVDSAQEISRTLLRVSQRAVRPFTLTGTPIEGTTAAEGAPLISQGQWTDVIGAKGSARAALHYRLERTIPGSTLHVVATTRGTPGTDAIELTLTDPRGEECDTADDYRQVDGYSILSTQVMVGREGLMAREECWQSDALGVVVERDNLGADRPAPFSLTVFEEPPAEDVESLPEGDDTTEYVAPTVRRAAEEVTAGTSFADAPAVDTGLYELDIVPGESQILKVHLDWGQQFTMRAVFPAGTPGVQDLTGVQGPFADVKMYGSLTGGVAGAYVGTDGNTIMPGAHAGELTAMSPVVRYRNREAYDADGSYLPGDYFIVISANASHDGDSWVQPYKLAVEVLGEPSDGPAYRGGASVEDPMAAVAAGTTEASSAEQAAGDPAEPTEQAADAANDAKDDSAAAQPERAAQSSTSAAMLTGAGIAVAVLAAAAGGWLLLRRARRS